MQVERPPRLLATKVRYFTVNLLSESRSDLNLSNTNTEDRHPSVRSSEFNKLKPVKLTNDEEAFPFK